MPADRAGSHTPDTNGSSLGGGFVGSSRQVEQKADFEMGILVPELFVAWEWKFILVALKETLRSHGQ